MIRLFNCQEKKRRIWLNMTKKCLKLVDCKTIDIYPQAQWWLPFEMQSMEGKKLGCFSSPSPPLWWQLTSGKEPFLWNSLCRLTANFWGGISMLRDNYQSFRPPLEWEAGLATHQPGSRYKTRVWKGEIQNTNQSQNQFGQKCIVTTSEDVAEAITEGRGNCEFLPEPNSVTAFLPRWSGRPAMGQRLLLATALWHNFFLPGFMT